MKCDFCGHIFEMNESKNGCKGCPMSKSCGKIKCPNCNYEMYPVPKSKILNLLKTWGKIIWKK
jgi:hypothetical protein